MKFKIGDIVRFNPTYSGFAAKKGAIAKVMDKNPDWLIVSWIRNELSANQGDGGYLYTHFEKIGISNPNSNIIVKQ